MSFAPVIAPPSPRQDSRPVIPDRVEDVGIPRSLVGDLILRYLWLHGSATLASLNETLKLSFPVLETMFHQFRQQQLLDVKGMLGNDYSFTLTAAGRSQATARNEVCQYAGPAPVSIQQYQEVVKSQVATSGSAGRACGRRSRTWSCPTRFSITWVRPSSATSRCSCTAEPAMVRPALPSAFCGSITIQSWSLTRWR